MEPPQVHFPSYETEKKRRRGPKHEKQHEITKTGVIISQDVEGSLQDATGHLRDAGNKIFRTKYYFYYKV